MKTFFISYELVTSYYMEPSSKNRRQQKSAMVEAETEALAKETLDKYWESQSDEYGEIHWVSDSDVALTLKQTEILSPKKEN